MTIKNLTQLITYPDSMGGSLDNLAQLLEQHFRPIFPGGVHILPPFPSSGDRGFAPYDTYQIDPQFGTWDDVRRIGQYFDVLLDLMVNHISRRSVYFQDFERYGQASQWADLFLPLDKVWPGVRTHAGLPPTQDVAKIFLRRPEHPFTDIRIETTGEVERVWATFGGRDWVEQIDLDVQSPLTRRMFHDLLSFMRQQGVRIVRLDAIAYTIKKAGTSCFFVEPEIWEFLDWLRTEADALGMDLLPEVHADPALQFRLAQHGFWVYNFVLPLLILHTLQNRSSRALQDHLRTCPPRQFTMLDTHDGIPVQPDIEGVLDLESTERVVETCVQCGANLSRILSPAHLKRPGFDAHQINCTYYSALGEDDDAYLSARALQLFAPGVPQVYYVGLLAGVNAPQEVERTGERRAINRRNYSTQEVEAALHKPVVRRLLDLIHFRNTYPAFQGTFQVHNSPGTSVQLGWRSSAHACQLQVDLPGGRAAITYRDDHGGWQTYTP